ERLPLIDAAGPAALAPDEVLADQALHRLEPGRVLVEVRAARVVVEVCWQLVANGGGDHGASRLLQPAPERPAANPPGVVHGSKAGRESSRAVSGRGVDRVFGLGHPNSRWIGALTRESEGRDAQKAHAPDRRSGRGCRRGCGSGLGRGRAPGDRGHHRQRSIPAERDQGEGEHPVRARRHQQERQGGGVREQGSPCREGRAGRQDCQRAHPRAEARHLPLLRRLQQGGSRPHRRRVAPRPMGGTFVLTLREGFEAALVLGIVYTYLQKIGAERQYRYATRGGLLGVLASIALGVVVTALSGPLLDPGPDVLWLGVIFVAVVVLTWHGYWMRQHARAMSGDVQRQIDAAQATHRMWIIGGIAFTGVFREGAETVLFLWGLLTQATSTSGWASALGAVLGLLTAFSIGWGIFRCGRRVSVKRFFGVTSVFLLLLAAGMFSTGIGRLEVMGFLPA